MLGHEFPVLPSAMESLAQYKLGQVITLLLTADNQVAGATTGVSGSTAVGIVQEDITLPKPRWICLNGLTLSGDPRLTDSTAALYAGELVTVSSYARARFRSPTQQLRRVRRLDLQNLTLGTAPLSPAVKIFERDGTGAVEQISLSDLTRPKSARRKCSTPAKTSRTDRSAAAQRRDRGQVYYGFCMKKE